MITDILDNFGNLVADRIQEKAVRQQLRPSLCSGVVVYPPPFVPPSYLVPPNHASVTLVPPSYRCLYRRIQEKAGLSSTIPPFVGGATPRTTYQCTNETTVPLYHRKTLALRLPTTRALPSLVPLLVPSPRQHISPGLHPTGHKPSGQSPGQLHGGDGPRACTATSTFLFWAFPTYDLRSVIVVNTGV